jgi:predicted phosphodiesterase
MQTLAFVSDIHGNLPALQAVDRDIATQSVDVVVNLGDALSGPLLARQTAHWLLQRDALSEGTPWLHIAGNHDRQLLVAHRRLASGQPVRNPVDSDHLAAQQMDAAALAWVQALPSSIQPGLWQGAWNPALLGHDVAVCHGSPRYDTEYLLDTPEGEQVRMATEEELAERLTPLLPPQITLLACGHSHLPRSLTQPRNGATNLRLLNPGSVGLPAYDDDSPYPGSSYHRVENGSPDARYAIASRSSPLAPWTIALRCVPYDHEPMARLAEQSGRPDWAHALLTGRMPRH